MLLLSCELDKANCVGQCGTLLLGRLTWKPVRTVSGRCVYVLGRGGGGQVTEEWETISARWWLGGKVVVSGASGIVTHCEEEEAFPETHLCIVTI